MASGDPMAGNRTERAWRPQVVSVARTTRSAGPAWRRVERQPAERRRRRQGLRVLVASVLFGAALGLLVWISTWLRPPGNVGMVLIGARYARRLTVPQNMPGWQGLEGIAKILSSEQTEASLRPGRIRLAGAPGTLRLDSSWEARLLGVPESTVVVVMSAHGASDTDGPYLIPEDFDIFQRDKTIIRFREVLEQFRELPERRQKVLILDANRIAADWTLGVLDNEFARGLLALDDEIRSIPNLVVINACDVEQRSWSSDEWRRTAFLEFLGEGLAGAADRDGDERVTLWELHSFTASRVAAWTWANRGQPQNPLLLPTGEEGRRRAEEMVIATTPSSPRAAEPEPRAPGPAPEEWTGLWTRFQERSTRTPSLVTRARYLWRRYQALLLRYDELWRAGEIANAEEVRFMIKDIEQDIDSIEFIPLSSSENTLTMPVAEGAPPPNLENASAAWVQLWNAPPAERLTIWKKWRESAPARTPGTQDIFLELGDIIMRAATETPREGLPRAAELVRVIRDPSRPLPAELHFLVMLNRDLATPRPPDDLISTAIATRRLAERAALGVEAGGVALPDYIRRWVAPIIDKADEERRSAEDLLFSSLASDWNESRARFEKARKSYDVAKRRAEIVQSAVEIQTRVISILPFYSLWVASRDLDNDRPEDDLTAFAVRLWQNTHDLGAKLGHALPETPLEPWNSLLDLALSVDRDMQELQRRYAERWQRLDGIETPSLLVEAEAALMVPYPDVGFRRRLTEQFRQASYRLLRGSLDLSDSSPNLEPGISRGRAMARARRQGRLALAAIGKEWFDQCPGENLEKHEQVAFRLENFSTEDRWWESIEIAGRQIYLRFRELPAAINQLVRHSSTAASDERREDLSNADRLVRLMPPNLASFLLENPVDLLRRRRLVDLLSWQARRTLADHWFAYDPDVEPYYRLAARRFLDDAIRLAAGDAELAEVRAIERIVNSSGELRVVGEEDIAITSQQSVPATFTVEVPPGSNAPPGQPVVWLTSGPSINLLSPTNERRAIGKVEASTPAVSVPCQLASPLVAAAETAPPPTPDPTESVVAIHSLYRGQRLTLSTPIRIWPIAERIERSTPPPTRGSVAVQTTRGVDQRFGAASAALTVVLDCSGSMGAPQGEVGPTTKYIEAVEALKSVLARVPLGTTVSVWAFGQSLGAARTAPAEQTIKRVLDPVSWNPADNQQLADLMAKISYPALEPWNESPVVRAMVEARGDLLGFGGYKNLIVITDGVDNRFARDAEINPTGMDIPTFLTSQFQNTAIVVDVIGFKVGAGEVESARRQFSVVKSFSLPGDWYAVDQAQDLADTMSRAISRRLRYWVERESGVLAPGCPENGVEANGVGSGPVWFPQGLEPGAYWLRLRGDQLVRRNAVLKRGDLLLLNLVGSAAGVGFQRADWTKEELSWRPSVESGGWRLVALRNQLLDDKGLVMLFALDNVSDLNSQVSAQVVSPRAAWIRVTAKGADKTPFTQQWTRVFGYPAPTWEVRVPAWPTLPGGKIPAAPVVTAWWDPEQAPAALATISSPNDFGAPRDLANMKVSGLAEAVTVQSVTVEDHRVEVKPDRFEVRPCLVVRAVPQRGRTVMARLLGQETAGQEHRFYDKAGQYTGLFWPITRDQALAGPLAIDLISVDDFQRSTQSRRFSVELNQLAPPDPGDIAPAPIHPWPP